jgi:hypothetical protein
MTSDSRRTALRTLLYSTLVVASAAPAGRAAAQTSAPAAIPPKFLPDGGPAHWPGNTILCHIDKKSAAFLALLDIHVALMRSGLQAHIAPLPPASYHMTIFEGISYPARHRYFPSDLPSDASEAACNAAFLDKLRRFDLDTALPIRMCPLPLAQQTNLSSIRLEPADAAENRKLRALRDRLAGTLKFRTARHDDYRFHITLNYVYSPLDAASREQLASLHQRLLADFIARSPLIELGAPEFTCFDDMLEFRPQLLLTNHAK